MVKKRSLWFLFCTLTLVTVLCLTPTVGAWAAADEYGLETLPEPIDPQSWRMQRDMTWDDWTPNPFTDWRQNDTIAPERVLKGALILIDYPDQPFLVTQPVGTDPLGNPRVGNVA